MSKTGGLRWGGLLVVRRWQNEEGAVVAKNYGGFDGDPWPGKLGVLADFIEDGLVAATHFSRVKSYYDVVSKLWPCDLVYLSFGTTAALPDSLQTRFRLRGYDCGFYKSEFSCFSAILNEVLGSFEILAEVRKWLNPHLLFPSFEVANRFRQMRAKLLRKGIGLESGGPSCRVITVHGT